MRPNQILGSLGVAALIALATLGVLSLAEGADGDIPVRFEGRVLWIAGETVTVATDDDQSISVDLSRTYLKISISVYGATTVSW